MAVGAAHERPAEALFPEGRGGGNSIDISHFFIPAGHIEPVQGGSDLAVHGDAAAALGGVGGREKFIQEGIAVTEGILPELAQLRELPGGGSINPHLGPP